MDKPPPAPSATATAPSPSTRFVGKCQYKTGKCFKERTLKRNGQAHSLCEEHRVKQNLIQRRSDRKYQSLHAVRRKERSQIKAMFKKQVTMAVAHQLYFEHQHHKMLNPLAFHNSAMAATTTTSAAAPHHSSPTAPPHVALPVGYHAMLPPVPPSMLLCGLPKSTYDSPVVHKTGKQPALPQGISPLGTSATNTALAHHDHPHAALARKECKHLMEERSWKHAANAADSPPELHQQHNVNPNAASVDSWSDDDVQLLQSILLV